MGERLDKRVSVTRSVVRDAFAACVSRSGVSKITITDLCREAGINRGTFYNHWKSVGDLTKELEDAFLRVMLDCVILFPSISPERINDHLSSGTPVYSVSAVFGSLAEWSSFAMAILGPNGDREYDFHLRKSFKDCFYENIVRKRFKYVNDYDADLYSSFYSSAILGLMACWMSNGCKESPDAMSLKLLRLMYRIPDGYICL